MEIDDAAGKRGRGRGRTTRTRARGRGRGRGRGKKATVVVSSDEEAHMEQGYDHISTVQLEDCDISGGNNIEISDETITRKDIDIEHNTNVNNTLTVQRTSNVNQTSIITPTTQNLTQTVATTNIRSQTIDMEADISQLEAPTFTTLSRGPPEPMLRLKWNHKVNLIGEKVLNPMIHICDQCDKPILHYGRMIPCKHVFCLKCARTEPIKLCPRCNDKVIRVEQSGLGTVFMCTHSGSRYGNTGCRRTYLSQRDLQAHINHRHVTQPTHSTSTLSGSTASSVDVKTDVNTQRKVPEAPVITSTMQQPSSNVLLTQRSAIRSSVSSIGSIAPPGSSSSSITVATTTHSSLTQANLARINNANAADCHQGKVALHQTLKKASLTQSHHQHLEAVADASYYSSVLNSFGSTASSTSSTNISAVTVSGSCGGSGSGSVGGGGGGVSAGGGGGGVSGGGSAGSGVGIGVSGNALATATSTPGSTTQTASSVQGSWQTSSYYR